MKCFETSQESQECSTQETNQVLQNNQNRFGNAFLQEMLSVDVDITGYASPEWNNPKGESPEELNESLAWERADSVEDELENIFQSFFTNGSNDIKINNHGGVIAKETDASSPEQMRRVDISAILNSYPNENYESPKISTNASKDWAIKVDVSGGAGGNGIAGGALFASLKNLRTGEIASGMFIGGGIGVGVTTPCASTSAPDEGWTEFQTQRFSTFEDFEGTPTRLTAISIGAGVLSASYGAISFVTMGEKAQRIDVSGVGAGAVGGDIVSLIGTWSMLDTSYSKTDNSPNNQFSKGNSALLEHSISFARGSSSISSSAREELTSFSKELELL